MILFKKNFLVLAFFLSVLHSIMKICFALLFVIILSVPGLTQQTVYKFDFGSGKTTPDYIQINPDTKFNYQTG
jgi:hypothetical protein